MLSVTKQMKVNTKIIKQVTVNSVDNYIKIQLTSPFINEFYFLAASLSTIISILKLKSTDKENIENFIHIVPYVPLINTKNMIDYILLNTSDICSMFELINLSLYKDNKENFKKQTQKILIIKDYKYIDDIINTHTIYMGKVICNRNIKLIKSLYINSLININITKMKKIMQQESYDINIDIHIIKEAINNIEAIIKKKIQTNIFYSNNEAIITIM